MALDKLLLRSMVVVDRELRREFPENFDKRCFYSVQAIASLLRDGGLEAKVIAGEFVGFVVAADGRKAGMQGFGGDKMSHVWVEAGGRRIDLGFSYLPHGSSFPAAPMPALAWQVEQHMPAYLSYTTTVRADDFAFENGELIDRCRLFVERCRSRLSSQLGNPKAPFWFLEGPSSAAEAAVRGDVWARNALLFQRRVTAGEISAAPPAFPSRSR